MWYCLLFQQLLVRGLGAVAQLIEFLPSPQEALGSIFNTMHTGLVVRASNASSRVQARGVCVGGGVRSSRTS